MEKSGFCPIPTTRHFSDIQYKKKRVNSLPTPRIRIKSGQTIKPKQERKFKTVIRKSGSRFGNVEGRRLNFVSLRFRSNKERVLFFQNSVS